MVRVMRAWKVHDGRTLFLLLRSVEESLLMERSVCVCSLLCSGKHRNTYARARSPTHVRMSGERPIELQMTAAVFRPMLEEFEIVPNWQHDPTIRMRAKMIRKYHPELLKIP